MTDTDAAVGYYGIGIEGLLGEAAKIKKPLLLQIAEGDDYVPPPAQDQIKQGLKSNPQVTIRGVEQAKAEELVQRAHRICPYSNAIRGNIDVDFTVLTD